MAGPWVALAGWLRRRRVRAPAMGTERDIDAWAGPDASAPPAAIALLLADIERTALGIYAAHGLPTRAGHYARGPRARRWRFISDHLGAEERWALVLDRPPEIGWRYSALEDLGAHEHGRPELRAAAGLLAGCSRLRRRLRERGSTPLADDLEAAIRLGADWRSLQLIGLRSDASRLKLTAPQPARLPRRKA